ncbi:MAG: hypothetical protein Ct9H300mP27_01120 [Chloroflexota bacterium]|nr:MAG: hypothetical protein Ct9H300mP27_01120 [Chloroflexota bacterium]
MINLRPSTLAVGGKKHSLCLGRSMYRRGHEAKYFVISIFSQYLNPADRRIIWLELRAVGIGFSYSG